MSCHIEIFGGTGGVGKTTLSTSRAYQLSKNNKVLLITIDPSKRLKQLFQISDDKQGEIQSIHDPFEKNKSTKLDILLMNPQSTMRKIAKLCNAHEFENNPILKILSKPHGGLNEILSLVELNLHYKDHLYDYIILDTPPGSHFIDFLKSTEKIESFFDKKFIEVFDFINTKSDKKKSGFSMKLVTAGIKKLLGYLEKVTGAGFISEFTDAIGQIYQTKDVFLDSIELKTKLKSTRYATWYLVTSIEQSKSVDALKLYKSAQQYFQGELKLIVNKSIQRRLLNWQPESKKLKDLKISLEKRENDLLLFLQKNFNDMTLFDEIIDIDPKEHVLNLSNQWQKYNKN